MVDDNLTVTITPVDGPPSVVNEIADVVVNEDAIDTTLDLTTTFNDVDDDNASISIDAVSSDDSLVTVTMIGNLLTLDYQPDRHGVAVVTVTATSDGKTVEDNVVVTVSPVDDPPVLANAMVDFAVTEDAPDMLIDLANVFNDIDDDNASITKVALSSDSTLVTAKVSGDLLTLDYQPDKYGSAVINVTATSNGVAVDDNVTVTVISVDDSPIVANPISDITVAEDAANMSIDLTNVFDDVDNDNG
ncbi:uncharacterized protein METZ01_LOCUS450460, partial [marine metagenome]